MVWGAMIALACIAPLQPDVLFQSQDLICKTIDKGSVITQDGGMKTLSLVAAAKKEYQAALTPFLMDFLRNCRPSDVPRHAEFVAVCVDVSNKAEFIEVLGKRMGDLSPTQTTRVKKILKRFS